MPPEAFPPEVVESLLVKSHRYCCLCHTFAGTGMEIHHIDPEGPNTEDNGIPLCLMCHQEVGAYDPSHPKGRKFTPSELKKHRDQWFSILSMSPFSTRQNVTLEPEPASLSPEVFESLRLDDRMPARRLVARYISNPKDRQDLIGEVFKQLDSDSENIRWKMGFIIEELIEWEPSLVPDEILEKRSKDESFSVRSSAALCYYLLAFADPGRVPIRIVAKLAHYDEDWYVFKPALACLKRLAKSRELALDIIFSYLKYKDHNVREHGANAIMEISTVDPLILKYRKEEIEKEIQRYAEKEHRFVRKSLETSLANLKNPPSSADYSPF